MTSSSRGLTYDLCKALGLPRNTVRAVLTIDANDPPKLEIEVWPVDDAGRPIVQEAAGDYSEPIAKRLTKLKFRLQPEPPEEPPGTLRP